MSGLLLVSNRLPVTVAVDRDGDVHVEASMGGLATGLARPHEQRGGVWLGWPGDVSSLSADQLDHVEEQLRSFRCVPLYLTTQEVKGYYEGFSNRVLWPVFHLMPEIVPAEGRHFRPYRAVNERFADAAIERAPPEDLIWVHDYHLLLVPGLIRRRLRAARIGFFLHIPFPPADLFRTLPWCRELLNGMLGADVIGFHTKNDVRNFAAAVREILDLDVVDDGVRLPGGRVARLGDFPMGVDAEALDDLARDPAVVKDAEVIRADVGSRHQRLVLGIDRLDYTKGIPRRLLAIRRLFARRAELRGHVRFVQIAAPSRENVDAYEALRHEVETLTGRVNSQFGDVESVPVHYLCRGFDLRRLVALYRAADVMLVTPLRDGMNLVAKEFVASRPDLDGVLVLSEFAGAAEELPEAMVVNPYDIDQVAESVWRALTMPRSERRRRMHSLRQRVRSNNVHRWAGAFLAELESAASARTETSVFETDPREIENALRAASDRVLLLDYDGTLVPLADRPELAAPDAELLELLRQLAGLGSTHVHVVSGRPHEVLDEWLGSLPVGLHAEHGLWSRASPEAPWQMREDIPRSWIPAVRRLLDTYVARAPGSFVEAKTASLAWHYRLVDHELGPKYARELEAELKKTRDGEPIDIIHGHRVVEVRARGIHKGLVVAQAVASAGAEDPLVAAFGDDRTDEDLFAALPEHSIAVHVGPGASRARARISSPEGLRSLLWTLVESPRARVSEAEAMAP